MVEAGCTSWCQLLLEREAPAVETVRAQLTEHLRAGRAVVLDHGLSRRSDREECR
ncbi:hypothetical protein [Streptomyces broussonetiae]|uniref:hypothetical protein n=1 Tax=Streptomyces broussonetiae TaxID=2686304 RepID=UPI0035D97CD9